MFNSKLVFLCFIYFFNFYFSAAENVEVSYTINLKKPAQCVSEKFISISIDPAVLLAGVNLSENSLRLAKHLSPAYIRIAGPSTQFIKYEDQDVTAENFLSDDGNNVIITPALWFGANEWLKLAKLMPIYGLNDGDTAKGLWNPRSTLPLLEISDKLNVSCYWQLGYDSSDKNETRYKQDINIFHYILTAYGRNDTWKLIGSDVSSMPIDRIENLMVEENDVLEAVMWEQIGRTLDSFPEKDGAYKILMHQSSKPRTKLWTTVPKSAEPVCFGSALLWAKQVGNAAKMGFDVIFRQPRIYELFIDTPIYWFSVLHKELMGCHVLDTKSTIPQEESDVFAHCTRKQNSFVRRGALTVMVVNDRPDKYKVKLKFSNSIPEKSIEVKSYILTSTDNNSTEIYLNGKLLTTKIFQEKEPFQPKIRQAKLSHQLLLSLPPSSIGFFVLPGARVPVCTDYEKETKLLLQEIEDNQNNGLSEEVALRLGPRASFTRNTLLEEIAQKLKEEMKSDEKFYNKHPPAKSDEPSKFQENDDSDEGKSKVDEKARKLFIDRVKFADKHKKALEFQRSTKKVDGFKKFLFDKSKSLKHDSKIEEKPKKMDLTSDEIEKILKDRAVERAAKKNIVFTDEELDALIRKASKNYDSSRTRRDINMDLLEKYGKDNIHIVNMEDHIGDELKGSNPKSRAKRSLHNIKKRIRSPRAINVDLLDLKAKIAEHKRAWEDRKDELLGNTNSIKQSIKDKIRELKSRRVKRDINSDFTGKITKRRAKHSKKKSKTNEEVEATIRQSGQTSADILEELERAHALEEEDEDVEENQGEVFAELANSEDLEEDLLFNTPPKPKKLTLFDKKPKIDPFAVQHPTIDIVEPSRRRSKKKKPKSEDKLQFLTTSEEFTDIEDDVPGIHEFYGAERVVEKKKGFGKSGIEEVNDFYGVPRLMKRDVSRISRDKRGATLSILELAKFEHDLEPNAVFFAPVLELPLLNELYYDINSNVAEHGNTLKSQDIDSHNSKQTGNSNHGNSINGPIQEVLSKNIILDLNNQVDNSEGSPTIQLTNLEYNKDNEPQDISSNESETDGNEKNDFNKFPSHELEITENFDLIKDQNSQQTDKETVNEQNMGGNFDIEDDISELLSLLENSDGEHLDNTLQLLESDNEHHRNKRSIPLPENSEDKPKKKKNIGKKADKKDRKSTSKKDQKNKKDKSLKKNKIRENAFIADQMHTIRDKFQGKKEEIDKMLEKQKEMETEIKEQWKSKLSKKKKSKKQKGSSPIDSPDLKLRNTDTDIKSDGVNADGINTDVANPEKIDPIVRRSIFNLNDFGSYQPQTTNLKRWKPADILSLNNQIKISDRLNSPKDNDHFKDIFKNSLERKKRHIDTDVDFLANGIDDSINEIKKDGLLDLENRDLSGEKDPKINYKDDEIFQHLLKDIMSVGFNNLFEMDQKGDQTETQTPDYKDVIDTPDLDNLRNINDVLQQSNQNFDNFVNNNQEKINDENFNENDDKNYTVNEPTININNETIKIDEISNDKFENSDGSIKDGDYHVKLPNNDELEIVQTGDDTEIKFLIHDHDEEKFNMNEKSDSPKITPRTMKPLQEIQDFFGQINTVFNKIGQEIKHYFYRIGLN